MTNDDLAHDYLHRSAIRLKAIQVLYDERSWADVVRECQEVVELCLKARLRMHGISFPRTHDVSQVLVQESARFPASIQAKIPFLATTSRSLRRDRELAFYGSEDLTPSSFYLEEDAHLAFDSAKTVLDIVSSKI
jgi:HEPN domain-containing protein